MNVLLLMIDSLNRNYLSPYGAKDIDTPNFRRLARKCVTVDNHWTGSLPTMPTRHEVMAGRYEYPWRGWGPIEPYDVSLAQMCQGQDIVSMFLTDCYHYFAEGAGNYHSEFDGFEFLRGHERDNWKTAPVEPFGPYKKMIGERGEASAPYMKNTAAFRTERDFFGPRIMTEAAKWLDENHMHKKFFFVIDSFDTHEPFHVPPPYDKMFDPDFIGESVIWPVYGSADRYPKEVVRNIRAQYLGKIAMLDKNLGLVLDRLDRYNLWDNTLVIATTDHGHHFGENGILGKNIPPYHTTLTHIPLFISLPGMKTRPGSHSKLLTSSIDLYPTIAQALDLKPPRGYVVHGYSILPALQGKTKKIRDIAHTSYFGGPVVVTDGRWALHKFPNAANQPLATYGIRLERFHARVIEPYLQADTGRFVPFTKAPVYRVKLKKPPALGRTATDSGGGHPDLLFDLKIGDSSLRKNVLRKNPRVAARLKKQLREEFKRIKAPKEHLERLELND
jgi:arylsulfatase A-like enzyme